MALIQESTLPELKALNVLINIGGRMDEVASQLECD